MVRRFRELRGLRRKRRNRRPTLCFVMNNESFKNSFNDQLIVRREE
jgi:hypothetical protein